MKKKTIKVRCDLCGKRDADYVIHLHAFDKHKMISPIPTGFWCKKCYNNYPPTLI